MIRKITNPFPGLAGEGYQCFGCSPFNDHGLQLLFWDNDGEVICKWSPSAKFEGYRGIVHGGILAAIIDETASWFILTQHNTTGVTSEMTIKYLKPARIANGEIKVTARFLRKKKQIVTVSCVVTDGTGIQCAISEVSCFIFPENIAGSKYNYPGPDAFYT